MTIRIRQAQHKDVQADIYFSLLPIVFTKR
jgi:hypothetical protein